VVLTIELTPEREQKLAELAQREGKSVEDIALGLLDEGIAEAAEDAELADSYEAWIAAGRPSRPISELLAELDD